MYPKKLFIFLAIFFTSHIILAQDFKNIADTTDKIDFSLEDLLTLEVTTASKKAETISQIPSSTFIITRTEIKRYGYKNLLEVFSHIPGLYVVDYKGYLGPSIGVRGYLTQLNTNIIILLNGNPLKSEHYNAFSFNLTDIPVEAIDRIEVVRGPMSVIYGSNAFFGAINIITNDIKFIPHKNHSISYTYGYPNSNQLSYFAYDESDNFKYSFTTGLYDYKGIDEPFNKMISDFNVKSTSFGIFDNNKRSKNYFNKKAFFTNFNGSTNSLSFDLTFNKSFFGQTFSTLFYHPAENKLTFFISSISKKFEFDEKLQIQAKFTYNNFFLYMADNYYSLDTNGFGNENDIYSYGEYFSDNFVFNFDLFYKHSDNLNIQSGLEYNYVFDAGDKTDAPFNPNNYNLINRAGGLDNSQYKRLAFYLQSTYNLTDKLSLIGGFRVEKIMPFDLILHRGAYTAGHQKFTQHFNDKNLHLVSRAAAIYNLDDNNKIKLLYSEAIRFPSLWELRNNIITQKTIKPEKIRSEEINYISLLSKNCAIYINIFANQLDKLLNRTIILTPPYYSYYSNQKYINTFGGEIILTYEPTNKIKSEVSLTYQESKYKNQHYKDIKIEYSPTYLGYFKFTYLFDDIYSANLAVNYVDEMYAQWDDNFKNPANPSLGKIGRYGDKVKSYVLANLNILGSNFYQIGNTKFSFALTITNLFNSEIRYAANSVSAWADKGILAHRRNYLLSTKIYF